MKRVFSHDNRLIVYNLQNVLQDAGIETEIRNEFTGGGAGDLPAIDTWPEIWVCDDVDAGQARRLIDQVMNLPPADDWFCPRCHESNGAAFQICWSCGFSPES